MKVDFVICGDLHLSDDTPQCRLDDYIKARNRKILFISELCRKNKCPAIFPGDVFDKYRVSPKLEAWSILNLPEFIAVAGQHDLPYNNIANFEQSSLNVLWAGRDGTSSVLVPSLPQVVCTNSKVEFFGYWWGRDISDKPKVFDESVERKVAVMHKMVWTTRIPYPGCTADSAQKLLMKMKEFDLIITGDNHQHFMVEHEGRVLVNCGSLMRMEASQIDHKPCVYLYNAESNTVEKVELPIRKGVVSRDHIDIKVDRDNRRKALIRNLKTNTRPGLDFRKNITIALEGTTGEVKTHVNNSLVKK